jgi:hypothetical protein
LIQEWKRRECQKETLAQIERRVIEEKKRKEHWEMMERRRLADL